MAACVHVHVHVALASYAWPRIPAAVVNTYIQNNALASPGHRWLMHMAQGVRRPRPQTNRATSVATVAD